MSQIANQGKKKHSSGQNIKVAVRVRPLNEDERARRVRTTVQCVSAREIQTREKKYNFDRVFDSESTQMDIYQYVVAPMISDVLAGYNCTVFAYGQTGTGKTHTMTGMENGLTTNVNWKEDDLAGCIPRAAANIFDEIGMMKVTDYHVRVSFLELYNEEARDLLSQDERPPPLNMFSDNKGSVCIQNLNEITVFSSNDIFALLQQGTHKRQTAATLMNNCSSRSHTVFTITVHTREIDISGEEVLKTGKINLVDLAGSENIFRSGAKDKRAQELANINKSLLTLGRVIHILAEKTNKHVPYRDSKLTRILQDSLGGHTKTCIIATISPSHESIEETLSTLEYACRARDIRNTPMVNEKVTKTQMIKDLTQEIEKLQKDLDAARSGEGFFIDKTNWDELNTQLQSSSNALTLKNNAIEELKKKITERETILQIRTKDYEDVMDVCNHQTKKIEKAKTLLKNFKMSLKQEQYLAKCYYETATEHKLNADQLLEATKKLSKNQDILQRKLESQYYNNSTNEKIIQEAGAFLSSNISHAMTDIENFNFSLTVHLEGQGASVQSAKELCQSYSEDCNNFMEQSRFALEQQFASSDRSIEDSNRIGLETIDRLRKENESGKQLVKENEHYMEEVQEMFTKFDESASLKIKCREDLLMSMQKEMKIRLLNMRKKCEENLVKLKMRCEMEEEQINCLDDALKFADVYDESRLSWFNDERAEQEKLKEEYQNSCDRIKETNIQLTQCLNKTTTELNQYKTHCIESEKTLKSTQQNQSHLIKEVIANRQNLTTNFTSKNIAELHSIQEKIDKLRSNAESSITRVKNILNITEEAQKEKFQSIITVRRSGDTPKQNQLNFPKRIGEGALSRDVLIKRFREECLEDYGNESFQLNDSTVMDSVQSLDMSEENKENQKDLSPLTSSPT
ncbi:kinesin-like protein Klp61F [Anthonomus grandis grandis]|uniref:kinesin-like protein Klp61F n=1 Tax=Anthonomus grandis grandis TaxID=2921223 RepID=UPI0021664F91|nr:kinesin-like protein Klp61F [Anthonomus grandis grandis]